MDDPWAAPTASTSAAALAMQMPKSPPPRMSLSPPPEELDVADPWGAKVSPQLPKLPKWEARKSWEARPSWDNERERTSSPVIDEGWGGTAGTAELGRDGGAGSNVSSVRASFEQPTLQPTAEASPRASLEAIERISHDVERVSLEQEGYASPVHIATVTPPSFDSPPSPTLDTSIASLSINEPTVPPFDATDISHSPALETRPRASSIGSDFGDFGTGDADPWGAGNTSWKEAAEGGWGQEVDSDKRGEDEEETPKGWERNSDPATARAWDQEASWGGARAASPPPQTSKQEEDWEASQRRIALSEARAPFELITRLKKDWEDVAGDVVGQNKLETSEETESVLAAGATTVEDNARETLRGLTEPPDTTFAYATSATREKYTSALSRATPNATSLLRIPVRATRYEGLEFGPGLAGWGARSHLGEPEAPVATAAVEEAEPARGWSFWRRGTAPKPLVTSGGGMLEVKNETDTSRSETPVDLTSEPASVVPERTSRSSSIVAAPSIAPSVNVAPAISPSVGPPVTSRESPTLSRSGTPDLRPPTPASATEEKAAPQRATSGFWGRFRRRPPPSDEPQGLGQNDHELELGENDFAFLAEVPSMPQQGTDDLLGMDGPMANLDAVLGPKAVPLPAPLAPPPKANTQRPSQSSFQPRMAAPQRQASDFDLLSGLDFDSPAETTTPSNPAAKASITTPSAFNWDDLLSPSSSAPAPAKPPSSTPGSSSSRSGSPVPRLAPPLRASSPVPRTSSPLAGPPSMPSLNPTKPMSTLSPLSPNQSSTMSSMFDLASSNSNPSATSTGPSRTSYDGPPRPHSSVALNFGFAGASTPAAAPPAPKPSASPSPYGDLSSFASLAPSPPVSRQGSISGPVPPPLAAPMAPMQPVQPMQPSQPPQATDDFGDFGDFGSFDNAADDDFGDFSFTSNISPAPPTPIAKSPAPPTPIAKSPAYAPAPPPKSTFSTPSPARGASSSSTPVFSRPSNLPTGLRNKPRAPSDHRATLELLTAAATQTPAEREDPSPIAPALSPPPPSGSISGGFSFLPPPPSGTSRRKTNNVDLLGDLI